MKTYLVVTLTCPDRPGIVDRVTEVIARFDANWEESRMARLGGDFAGIVKIGVAGEQAEGLTRALRALASEEMTVLVKPTRDTSPASAQQARLFGLRLAGADHEGIVHKVAHFLAGQGINVEAMETEVVPAPMSATPVFHMTAQIRIPAEVQLPQLSASLERIGDELGVDIEIRPAEA